MDLHHDTHADVSDVIPLGNRWLVGWSASHWLALVDKEARLLNKDSAPITGFSLAPDGTAIACTQRDAEQVQVWTLDDPPVMRVLPGTTQWDNAIGYSMDGQRIYTAGGNWHVKIWDLTHGIQSTPFKHHENWINDMDVSPDGKQVSTCAWDNSARIWDVATGDQLFKLIDHGGAVQQCRYSPDGLKLTTACRDGVARVWNAKSGALITSLPKSNRVCFTAAIRPLTQQVAAPDSDVVNLYSLPDVKLLRSFKGNGGFIADLDFTIDGQRMVHAARMEPFVFGTAKLRN